jgi:vancomycin resistance protein YoaR
MRVVWLALAVAIPGIAYLGTREVTLYSARLMAQARDAVLDDYVVPSPPELDGFVAELAERVSLRTAYLDASPELLPVSFSDLGIELNILRTTDQCQKAPVLTTFGQCLRRMVKGPSPAPTRVTSSFTFDANRCRTTLRRLAPRVSRAPINAKLDLERHERILDWPGRELDIEATLAQIENGPREDGTVVPLVFRRIPVTVTSAELPPVEIDRVLGRFETDFTHRGGPRAVNIRRGAQLLDRVILGPGATFSFNRTVGARTEQRGFINAPVIVHDEIDKGPGGGICQVATTLHAAAVYAGMEIIERRSHSRASGYAPLGLDATVIDGKVDLRFRNPYDSTLMIHAQLPTLTTIRVEILGRNPAGPVEHHAQVIKRYPFLRRIVEKAELAEGDVRRTQKGKYGFDIVSFVQFTQPDGSLTTHRYSSKYYPVPEVFWVAPGTPESALPPLPEGAEGIEPEPAESH